jgi:hypothetical protein
MLAPALQTIIVTKYFGARIQARHRVRPTRRTCRRNVSIYFDLARSKYIDTQMKIFYIVEKRVAQSRWENNSRTKT